MKSLIILLCFPITMFGQSLTLEIQQYFDLKDFTKAENRLLDYLEDNPNNIEAIELLGDFYGHQKKWNNAIESYKTLVDSVPNNANYHYKYGGALGMKALEVNKLKALTIIDDVKQAFLTAAHLDPNHIDTRWALVELYMKLPGIIGGSKNKSLQYANELEALSKVDGYLAKGYIHEYDDELEQAEIYYKKALHVGNSKTGYIKLSDFYLNQDKQDEAIHVLKEGYAKLNDEEFLKRITEITK